MAEEMTIKEFSRFLQQHLFDDHPEMAKDHTIEIVETMKNNGVNRCGLVIRKDGVNVSPTLYVEEAYDQYNDGMPIGEIANTMIEAYERHRVESFPMDFISEFSQVKEMLTMKVINTKMNEDRLLQMPHLLFGDLSVIFQIKVDKNMFGNATITIKNNILKLWKGVTVEDLYKAARENIIAQDPVRIDSMFDVLSGILPASKEEISNDFPMFVASNDSRINGAVAILFPETLRSLSDEMGKDLAILPSSVHELILIPKDDTFDSAAIRKMVIEVNESQVAPEEVLSDTVYFYDRKRNIVCFSDTLEPCMLTNDEKADVA